MNKTTLIKFGGGLITNKTKPFSVNQGIIDNLSKQIKYSLKSKPNLNLVIGTGAGSFGHYSVIRYKMENGINSKNDVFGYCYVQDSVARLNRIVVATLLKHGVNACSVSPSSIILSKNTKAKKLFIDTLTKMLKIGVVPVLHGDIILDEVQGCSIYSTEKIFKELVMRLKRENITVEKIIYCSAVEGVYDKDKRVISTINSMNFHEVKNQITKSYGMDVTGGMLHKVKESLNLTKTGVKIFIIDGKDKSLLKHAILKSPKKGTVIK